MTIEIIFIILSAVLLITTAAFAALWLKAKSKNAEYEQMSSDYEQLLKTVEDYKSDEDAGVAGVVKNLLETMDVYSPIMDDLIAARKELKAAAESAEGYPANAIAIVDCVSKDKVLWDKATRGDEETAKAYEERLGQIAKDIKDSYKPAEAEAVALLVKSHVRPMLDSLPNYRSFGEKERSEILEDIISMAFATIDTVLYTRQSDPENNENLLQINMLRGAISNDSAEAESRRVTNLESETPLWAIRLNTLLQDLSDKYDMPKRTLILKGYKFEIGH